MSVTVISAPPSVRPRIMTPDDDVWPLSVEQYHAMIRSGILTDDDPIELLEGVLVPKMTKNRPHTKMTWRIHRMIESLVPHGWYLDAQEPISTADSEPEPDIVVVRGNIEQYDDPPDAENVSFVVEVSDSTLQRDRGIKKRLYARAQIAVYWIVNLVDQQVEVYTRPRGAGDEADYAERKVYTLADAVPVVIDGVEAGQMRVRELWGK